MRLEQTSTGLIMPQTDSNLTFSEADRIGHLAETGERMIDQLRQRAFLEESRKGLMVRYALRKRRSFWAVRPIGFV
jgi:hypothetical protein